MKIQILKESENANNKSVNLLARFKQGFKSNKQVDRFVEVDSSVTARNLKSLG